MENNKIKKKWYKRWYIWILIILVLMVVIPNTSDEAAPVSTTNQTKNPDPPKDEPKKEEPKKEEPKIDFSSAELNNDNIKKAANTILGSKLVSSELIVEEGKNIGDIIYDPGTFWDDKSLVTNNAVTATKLMELLFTNPKVDKIWVWTQTEMTDAKGNKSMDNVVNVCLTKENAKDINWPEFKEMVSLDYNALYNIADSKFIHPGIAKNIK